MFNELFLDENLLNHNETDPPIFVAPPSPNATNFSSHHSDRPNADPSEKIPPNPKLIKKIPIHPAIDPWLNDEYHLKYAPNYCQSISYPWINSQLLSFYKMAGIKGRPYINRASESAHEAKDIILNEFVSYILEGRQPTDSNQNLVGALTSALIEAGFTRSQIDETCRTFDPELSVGTYNATYTNLHIIKARGKKNLKKEKKMFFNNFDDGRTDRRTDRWTVKLTKHF